MKKLKQILLLGLVLAAGLVLVNCNPVEDKSQSASLLTVLNVQGLDASGNATNYLNSDVVSVSSTGVSSVSADYAVALLSVATLDPNPIGGTSQYENVIVDRYVVSYSLPNGSAREGIDVPYSFEASVSFAIPVNTQSSLTFVVVRASAKQESPLIQLVNSGTVLQCTARIDFYGHDEANHTVTATGYLPIFFSNYPDASTGAATMRAFIHR